MSTELSPHEMLIALLKPYVEPLVKHRLKEEQQNMPLHQRVHIDGIMFILSLYSKCLWIRDWVRDKNFRQNPPSFLSAKSPRSQIEKEIDDFEIHRTLDGIVCFWMELLALSAEDRKKLILSELDDAMLPTKSPPICEKESIAQLLDEACAALVITAQDFRDILRAVRHSLPAGQVLPEAMKDYLKSAGVTVE